jgi:hypothetical protein
MTQRNSRVAWAGVSRGGGDLDGQLQQKLRQLLNDFGIVLEQEANSSNISIFAFPIFREFSIIAALAATDVFYAISPTRGGMPSAIWMDWRQKPHPSSPQEFLASIEQELGWTEITAFKFPLNLLDKEYSQREPELRLNAKGWVVKVLNEIEKQKRIVKFNPIFKGKDFLIENDLCFVLMPFREPFQRLYKDHIKPVLEAQGFRVLKADDIFTPTVITDDIWQYINKSRFVLADVTGKNPNVFYELGITHTVGKDAIILTQTEDDIPFDLRHLRHFTYVDNEDGWKALRENIEKVVKAITGE